MPTPDLSKVYDSIIAALKSGRLPVGVKLTEGTIARVLGINRTTVHLALRLMVKIQQSFSPISYTPPHKPQRSVVIFSGTPLEIADFSIQNPPAKVQTRESPSTITLPKVSPQNLGNLPSPQDVVRCPHCNTLIPGNEVRHTLHDTGTVMCPGCQIDLADVVRGNDVD
ncbi:MAG: hypothetical protein RBG13Loki_3255 [Promethearchaeota archaeon CR_4]|nr:MAG: hypothetical protein RBG13Loki_3255 [Candidatus Lokiarchaeota archaeon CR_4]